MQDTTRFKATIVDKNNVTGKPQHEINRETVAVGRSPVNDFVIPEKTVSSKHAYFQQRDDGVYLTDRGSTNGTRVNGEKLAPNQARKLNDGDQLIFDKYPFEFKVKAIQPAAPEQPAAPPKSVFETVDIGSVPPSTAAKPDLSGTMDIGTRPDVPPAGNGDTARSGGGGSDFSGTMDIGMRDGKEAKHAAGIAPIPGQDGEPDVIGVYQVLSLLGKGGFGSVYKAKDKNGKAVAIKMLNPDALENQRAVRKFFHEAIILSRLDHPNICRFVDFFPQGTNYAIVMDFVQGTDLKALLKKRSAPLPFNIACDLAKHTLDAFHYAHAQNVLHRDIKPENIVLDAKGNAHIMDFGIAKLSSAETQHTSATMISTAYTAPERFDAKGVADHRSDIYSLGMVFYEIFTGRHPFEASSPVEMIMHHMNTVPPSPADIADVPDAISSAIMTALEKDPDDRFDDFAAFEIAMFGKDPSALSETELHAGELAFADEYYNVGALLLKMYAGIIQKHRARAKKFRLAQDGCQVELILETTDGKTLRVAKDLKKILAAKKPS